MHVHRHLPVVGEPRQAADVVEVRVRQEDRRRPGAGAKQPLRLTANRPRVAGQARIDERPRRPFVRGVGDAVDVGHQRAQPEDSGRDALDVIGRVEAGHAAIGSNRCAGMIPTWAPCSR
jgi:hypothetical protein